MIIKNALVYGEDFLFHKGDICIQDGLFTDITPDDHDIIDASGLYAIPGLIDIHFHGCLGDDFCDGTKEAIHTLAKYEASVGVTAICPATLTLPVSELTDILRTAAE